ncbi:MAG: signal recognition particle-docking protein FtsY [Bacillota bacterium]
MSLFKQFKNGLSRSKTGFIGRLENLFDSGEIDEDFYEELEETLVSGDVGVQASMKLVDQLREELGKQKIKEKARAREIFRELIVSMMTPGDTILENSNEPALILLIGVNGTGKTTSAAKLAHLYKKEGKEVLLIAGDTFRAAAIEQLEIWADRAGVEIIKQKSGSDSAALFYDAINAARARKVDVVIGDTAGRLQSKYNLMEELNKIYRVVERNMPGAPHQVLLVVDATTGQNAVAQAKEFNKSMPIDGLVLAKLDGTARGGIVLNIQEELNIPVCYIGTGEKIEDLAPFNPEEFTRALLEDN